MAKSAKQPQEEKELTQKDVEKIIEKADKGYVEPRNAEEAAFQKGSVEGYDPNKLENPHSTAMTIAQAEEIVKRYGDFKGNEIPTELARARKILGQ
jgi:hypothetical protein